MLLLALDTATPATSVALHDGSGVLAGRAHVDARRHAEVLAPLIDAVLRAAGARPADLTLIACGVGPGPYTGLRIGITTARVMGAALGVPVVGACTLDALAWQAREGFHRPFGVATDARRREVYWATYDPDGTRRHGPLVNRPADVAADHPDLPFVGDGALVHAADFIETSQPRHPDAGHLADLVAAALRRGEPLPASAGPVPEDDPCGDGTPAAPGGTAVLLPPAPLYLRRPDAAVPGAPKPVTPGVPS